MQPDPNCTICEGKGEYPTYGSEMRPCPCLRPATSSMEKLIESMERHGKVEYKSAAAVISADNRYRYVLQRAWTHRPEKRLNIIMLNPSTADSKADDPTIRRCMQLAKDNGFYSFAVYNLYGFRADDPTKLFKAKDPIGPENDYFLNQINRSDPLLCAWGAGAPLVRVGQVLRILQGRRLMAFDLCDNKQPRHPLYLPSEAKLKPWRPL